MQRLPDNHLAGVYMRGFQTMHRYSAVHSAIQWRTETSNWYLTQQCRSIFHAWTEPHNSCISTNSNLDFVQQEKKKPKTNKQKKHPPLLYQKKSNSITFGKLYPSCMLFATQENWESLLWEASGQIPKWVENPELLGQNLRDIWTGIISDIFRKF